MMRLHDPVLLREIIIRHYTVSELKTMMQNLHLPDEYVQTDTISNAARELVSYMDRCNKLNRLRLEIYLTRPNVDVPGLPETFNRLIERFQHFITSWLTEENVIDVASMMNYPSEMSSDEIIRLAFKKGEVQKLILLIRLYAKDVDMVLDDVLDIAHLLDGAERPYLFAGPKIDTAKKMIALLKNDPSPEVITEALIFLLKQ